MDDWGYPDKKDLKKIREWDVVNDLPGLLQFLKSIWWQPAWGFVLTPLETELELHTGGWSGNEDIMEALQANEMFWTLFWYSSERGGHYKFHFYNYTEEK